MRKQSQSLKEGWKGQTVGFTPSGYTISLLRCLKATVVEGDTVP